MDRQFSVVIPARYASTRLPGKPLADIAGLPMIVRVARQALSSGAREVVIATDDDRVRSAVRKHGLDAVLTRTDHQSGSDRVMEVVAAKGWAPDHIVVNVQGDEPLIPPVVIEQVARLLIDNPNVSVATLCEAIDDVARVFDPNVVKLVRSVDGRALYFSRAPIPWRRDDFGSPNGPGLLRERAWWRHIGIYGYRVAGLARFCDLPTGTLERIETLEQLRLLENGIDIIVGDAVAEVPGGVDTPADLDRVRGLLASRDA
jgi:3-deoxy-manno-octulosonate cytidylyltransferase (CMP-KDO synthetase)